MISTKSVIVPAMIPMIIVFRLAYCLQVKFPKTNPVSSVMLNINLLANCVSAGSMTCTKERIGGILIMASSLLFNTNDSIRSFCASSLAKNYFHVSAVRFVMTPRFGSYKSDCLRVPFLPKKCYS